MLRKVSIFLGSLPVPLFSQHTKQRLVVAVGRSFSTNPVDMCTMLAMLSTHTSQAVRRVQSRVCLVNGLRSFVDRGDTFDREELGMLAG